MGRLINARNFYSLDECEGNDLYLRSLMNPWGLCQIGNVGSYRSIEQQTGRRGPGMGCVWRTRCKYRGAILDPENRQLLNFVAITRGQSVPRFRKAGLLAANQICCCEFRSGAARQWKTLYFGFTTGGRGGGSFWGAIMAPSQSKQRRRCRDQLRHHHGG